MHVDSVPDSLWPRLSESLAQTMGLNFPPERYRDLQRGLAEAAKAFGFAELGACADWMLFGALTAEQRHSLAGHFTIGETYFFRDRKTFEALAEHVVPSIVERRRGNERRLRLWSAACSTGEEAYSLAILLHELLPDWDDVSILATDINPRSLQKARAGIYGAWSFRESSAEFKQRYFTPMPDGRLVLSQSIKDRVQFESLNLSEDGFPSLATGTNAMDLILCRNLLMYFTPVHVRRLIDKLHHALIDEGWLIVSPSECSQELFSAYATVNRPGAILYRKSRPPLEQPLARAPNWQPVATAVPAVDRRTATEPVQRAAEPRPPATSAAAPDRLGPAQLRYRQGRYQECTDLLLASSDGSEDGSAPSSLAQSAASAGVHSLLTRALANQGKLIEALAACERWLAADKLDASAHYLHAMILQERGQQDLARRSLQRAVYLEPDYVLAHFALGNCARDDASDERARRHFDNALRLLRTHAADEPVPDSDGMSAGRLAEIISTLLQSSAA
ncbi:MAG TPA: CheR family methyltransferase [Steroidobacteraceae bacterium]|jgi:chemotaxis protein methyltransferase CheR